MRLRGVLFTTGLTILAFSITTAMASVLPGIEAGRIYELSLSDSFKDNGSNEGYFYTHGPVTVFAYEDPCQVTIRNPNDPDPPIRSVEVLPGARYYDTTLPAGFYYISTSQEAGVIAGVTDTDECNGYYHYRSSGSAYENKAFDSEWLFRTTNGCGGDAFLFAPAGMSSGYYCNDTLCLFKAGTPFSISESRRYHSFGPSDTHGYLEVENGSPVSILTRDGPGYFIPPYSIDSGTQSYFYTYYEEGEYLNIHSFADGTEVDVWSLTLPDPLNHIWGGTLNEGETHSIEGHFSFDRRILKIVTTKSQAAVSVLGGTIPGADNNYRTQLLDPAGNMQGTDFITRYHSGGFLMVVGLDNGTTVEVRDAETGDLEAVESIDQSQVWTAPLPVADNIWRIRSDKDVTVSVFKGRGATFIPLTRNTTGSHPFPPAISRPIRWEPLHPRSTDNHLTVNWLTDELATTMLHYSIGGGPWEFLSRPGHRTEHSRSIDISGIAEETEVRFWVEATDQSAMRTVEDNDGAYYAVTVRDVVPDIQVDFDSQTYEDRVYNVRLRVRNNGLAEARNVQVHMEFRGMQPIDEDATCRYDWVSADRIYATVQIDRMYTEWTTFANVNVTPFLSQRGDVDYELVSVATEGEDEWGNPVTWTNHPGARFDWDDAEVESRMNLDNTNYVVLANLHRFFDSHSETDPSGQAMPREMAAFAFARNAVLAYAYSGMPSRIEEYITSRFYGKVNEDWTDGGYLLLVGCSAVMPSFGWTLSCPTDTRRISMSDNTYANLNDDDRFLPELIIGRIPGDHPDHYIALFQRALAPVHFDRVVAMNGTGSGQEPFRRNAKSCYETLRDLYPGGVRRRLNQWNHGDRADLIIGDAPNTDFIYYRNHGGVGSWDDSAFVRGDVPNMDFNGKFPIVYSNACLTGKIQENSLAEAFLRHAAAVFIGATEVSPRYQNNYMGTFLTNRFRDGQTIGSAFRNAKRRLGGQIGNLSECTYRLRRLRNLAQYNLYGDPFIGPDSGVDEDGKASVVYDLPTSPINISVPMYEVESEESDIDYVTIPDEEHEDTWSVINEPIVPAYRIRAIYEPGIRVNDIQMASRSVMSNTSGLELPTSWGNQKVDPGPDDIPSPGTFPTEDFYWLTTESIDGGQELDLWVFPFFYNAGTKDATFYQEFSFDIEYVTSTVSIDAVTSEYDSVPLGQQQSFEILLTNGGEETQEVDVSVEIVPSMGDSRIAMLSENGVSLAPFTSDIRTIDWNPAGESTTHYDARISVLDANTSVELDRAYCQFRFGVPDVTIQEVTFKTAAPGWVGFSEDVTLGMEVASSGDVPVDGTMVMRIRRTTDGLLLMERKDGFVDLEPGAAHVYDEVWNSTGIQSGEYEFLCWAEHDGGVTSVSSELFHTFKNMRMGWSLPQDVYRHGDKVFATADLYEPDGAIVGLADRARLSVIGPTLQVDSPKLEQHIDSPHYSSSFVITAASPSGLHSLVYDATKAGYRYTAGLRGFVVTENGFAMTADPPVCIADGIATTTVTSDLVGVKKAAIPDGSMMTVTPYLGGKVITEDADPGTQGRQIASSGGRFQFVWQSPQHAALDAFVHGKMLGSNPPQSGISMRFKTIDFNGNRRVDVQDILFIQSGEGDRLGAPGYDIRKDLNEDAIVAVSDTLEVVDRWALEYSDAIHCSTCKPTIGTFGARLRPIPGRATIQPGEDLVVDIVAEGLVNLAGYEFGCVLSGDSLSWASAPEQSVVLEATGADQTNLGPTSYDSGYRIGAFSSGETASVGGSQTLGTLVLHANQIGESRLTLSSPLLAHEDGTAQAIMQAYEGIYQVAEATPTSTSTSTPTPSPTDTNTPDPTPSPTGTPREGDTNGDGQINALDLFHFCRFWESPADSADERCNPIQEVGEDRVNAEDLMYLMRKWSE